MPDQSISEMREHMEKSLHVFQEEMRKVRTGRANAAMVEDLPVDYYGTRTPLKHIAHVAAPEASLIVIRPYDKTQIKAIEKAILESDLGFNPSTEQEVIRVIVPKLTEERRNELVRYVHEKAEEARVAIRNIRRGLKEEFEKRKDKGEMSEDEFHRALKEIDEVTHEFTEKVDEAMAEKEKQITTV